MPGSPSSVGSATVPFLSPEAQVELHALEMGWVTFASSAIEADFVAFVHRTRLPLILVCLFELLVVSTVDVRALAAYPLAVDHVATALLCAVLAAALALTDAVHSRLNECAPRAVLTRPCRAAVHEILFCVTVLLSLRLVVKLVFRDPNEYDACAVGAGGSVDCAFVSYVDNGKLVLYTTLVPVRRIALLVLLPVAFILMCLVQLDNVFGASVAPFYDVDPSERFSRVAVAFLACVTPLIVSLAREPRQREHFSLALRTAASEEHRKHLQLLAGALLRATSAAAPAPGDGACNVLKGGEAVVAWIDLTPAATLGFPTAAGFSHVLIDATLDDIELHCALLQRCLSLIHEHGRNAALHAIEAAGDAIWLSSEPHADPTDSHDAHIEEETAQLVHIVHYALDVFSTAERAQPLWTSQIAACASVVVGVTTASAAHTAVRCVDAHSEALAVARRNCRALPRSEWAVRIDAEGFVMLTGAFATEALLEVGDPGAPLYVVGPASAPGARPAWAGGEHLRSSAPASDETPQTMVDAHDIVSAVPEDTGVEMALQTVGCCNLRYDACRFLFPRFADAAVEDAYVEHDNRAVKRSFAAHGLLTLCVLGLYFVLLLASKALTTPLMVAAFAACIVCACVTLVPAFALAAVGTPARVGLLAVFNGLAVGLAFLVAWRAPQSQAARATYMVLSPLLIVTGLVVPEHPVPRYALLCAVVGALWAVSLYCPVQGHSEEAREAWVGIFPAVLIAWLQSRAARAQFADVRYLEDEALREHQQILRAERTLSHFVPPAIFASFRAAPELPLSRAFATYNALVLYTEIEEAALRRTASQHALVHTLQTDTHEFAAAVAVYRTTLLAHLHDTLRTPPSGDKSTGKSVMDAAASWHVNVYGDGAIVVDLGLGTNAPSAARRVHLLFKLAVHYWYRCAHALTPPADAPHSTVTSTLAVNTDGGQHLTGSSPAAWVLGSPSSAAVADSPVRLALHGGPVFGSLCGPTGGRRFALHGAPLAEAVQLAIAPEAEGSIAVATAAQFQRVEAERHFVVGGVPARAIRLRRVTPSVADHMMPPSDPSEDTFSPQAAARIAAALRRSAAIDAYGAMPSGPAEDAPAAAAVSPFDARSRHATANSADQFTSLP